MPLSYLGSLSRLSTVTVKDSRYLHVCRALVEHLHADEVPNLGGRPVMTGLGGMSFDVQMQLTEVTGIVLDICNYR